MKKSVLFAIALLIMSLIIANPASAQPTGGAPNGRGMNRGNQMRMYDTKTVETLNGEILEIIKMPSKNGMANGVHLSFKTDKETIDVHLGPSWFIDKQDVKLNQNDKITVKGSRVTMGGKQAIVAAEITKDGKTMTLRNENGIPLWSGPKMNMQNK